MNLVRIPEKRTIKITQETNEQNVLNIESNVSTTVRLLQQTKL